MVVSLLCRGVNLTASEPSANTRVAFALQEALQASPLFDKEETQLSGEINQDEATGTFTFGMNLKLKRPLKF